MKKLLLAVFILCFSVVLLTGCFTFGYSKRVPKEGIWYCHELQIKMSFNRETMSYIIIDNVEIECVVLNDRGSDYISVLYQDSKNKLPDIRLGDSIFEGECRKLKDNTLYVEDENGDIYEFVRIE